MPPVEPHGFWSCGLIYIQQSIQVTPSKMLLLIVPLVCPGYFSRSLRRFAVAVRQMIEHTQSCQWMWFSNRAGPLREKFERQERHE